MTTLGPLRALRIAAAVEALSLAVLLGNLATVHHPTVTGIGGPVHGTAYLMVIASALLIPAESAVRWLTLVPGVGGLLALRRLRERPLS